MAVIRLETSIEAPINVCFDLSRSIDFHLDSAGNSQESAIAGVTTGLIRMGEEVTWRAKHIWWQELTSKIVEFNPPEHFRDSMVKGFFKRFDHDHFFKEDEEMTLMTDIFDFEGPFGSFPDDLILKPYLSRFLKERNMHLKACAEDASMWKKYLS